MQNPDQNVRKLGPLVVLVVVAAAVGVIGYLQAEPTATADRVYLRNGGGHVLFTHADHQDRTDGCIACHHELAGEIANECSECHDDGYEAGDLEHAELLEIEDHTCDACHEIGDESALGSCRACHPAAAAEPRDITCAECHDDPDYTPDLASHAELLEIEDHTCDACHVTRSVADVYHTQCQACHVAVDAERFTDAEGQTRCETCHLK